MRFKSGHGARRFSREALEVRQAEIHAGGTRHRDHVDRRVRAAPRHLPGEG